MVNTRRKSYIGSEKPPDDSDSSAPSSQIASEAANIRISSALQSTRMERGASSHAELHTSVRRTRTTSLPAQCGSPANKRTRKSSENSTTNMPVRTQRRSSSVTSDAEPCSQDMSVQRSSRTRRSSTGSVESPSSGKPHRKSLLERYRTEEGERLPAVAEEKVETGENNEEHIEMEEKEDATVEFNATVGKNVKADEVNVVVNILQEEGIDTQAKTSIKESSKISKTRTGTGSDTSKGKREVTEKEAATSLSAAKLAEIENILGTRPAENKPDPRTAEQDQLFSAPETFTRIKCPKVPRGKPKSGRFWKPLHTKMSQAIVRNRDSYEVRMQKLQQLKVVRDLEKQMRDEHKEKMQDLRKRREYNKKKAEENALKAEVYQVVKNPNKIKRMKKKQLRKLVTRDTTVLGKSVLDD